MVFGLPSYDFSLSSRPKTIEVNSDGELRHVICDLTNDHRPFSYRPY